MSQFRDFCSHWQRNLDIVFHHLYIYGNGIRHMSDIQKSSCDLIPESLHLESSDNVDWDSDRMSVCS